MGGHAMERAKIPFRRRIGTGWSFAAIGILAVLFFGAGVAQAGQFSVSASIHGNTVYYNACGAEPETDYAVAVEHDETGLWNTYDEQSDEYGEFSGSGTPGNAQIDPGDSVTVSVYDEDFNMLASTTVTAPGNVQPGKGFNIYLFLWLIARLFLIFF